MINYVIPLLGTMVTPIFNLAIIFFIALAFIATVPPLIRYLVSR